MWNLTGHERQVEMLDRRVGSGDLPHALLLVGPAGIGKRKLAVELAKALLCSESEPPCQQCLHCRQIEAGSHPDVLVIEATEGRDSITIQQARELREGAALRPFQASRKVYVIADAEKLTDQAADALLKTLEEPNRQVTIVLTAPDVSALPPTIVSRCETVTLGPIEAERIVAALKDQGASSEDAERLSRLARGRIGWALMAAKKPKMAEEAEQLVGRLAHVFEMGVRERLELAESLAADRKDRVAIRRNLELLILVARDRLLLSEGIEPELLSGSDPGIAARDNGLSREQIRDWLEGLRVAMERIDRNVDPRLTLEAALLAQP